MAGAPKRLGRGLSSLFNPVQVDQEDQADARSVTADHVDVPHSESKSPSKPVPAVAVPAVESRVTADSNRAAIPVVADEADVATARPAPAAPLATVRVEPKTQSIPEQPPINAAMTVAIDDIVPNRNQPRQVFSAESIASLAKSIEQSGIVQPLVVRPMRADNGAPSSLDVPGARHFELIAGERRWRAARAAGITHVPVIVRDLDDRAALEVALVENIQREDLNAIDRARAYQGYCREFEVGAEDLSLRLGEDRSTISNYMRLLELPRVVQKMVSSGQLSMGHARCILGLDGEEARTDVARAAVANALSVRAVEEMVRRRKGAPQGERAIRRSATKIPEKRPHIADLQNRLSQAVGTKVVIQEGRKRGSGKIVIEYYSLDDFDRISDRLGLSVD